eukprot:1158406-Pelagomonas_calceolata.AAC.7
MMGMREAVRLGREQAGYQGVRALDVTWDRGSMRKGGLFCTDTMDESRTPHSQGCPWLPFLYWQGLLKGDHHQNPQTSFVATSVASRCKP